MAAAQPPRIAAIVLTFNEARHISECLDSLRWADDRVVVDSISTDDTQALASAAGAAVVANPFENYAQQRNFALAHAGAMLPPADYVFFLDADERCSPELAAELREVATDPSHDVWAVPRHNYLFGKLTLGAGWYPDFQARFFRVGAADFDPVREVHEVARFKGEMGRLRAPLTHFNYEDVAQFHTKQKRYSEYDAGILFKQGVRPRPWTYFMQPLREFWRRFVTLKGWRDGLHGLHLSALMAWYRFDQTRRLARRWREAN